VQPALPDGPGLQPELGFCGGEHRHRRGHGDGGGGHGTTLTFVVLERSAIDSYRAAVNPARLEVLEAIGALRFFERAEGAWLEDASGRRFLDLVCGYGAAALGHRHPAVMEALAQALASPLPFTTPLGVPALAGHLAVELCTRAGPRFAKVYFGNSGAEGVE